LNIQIEAANNGGSTDKNLVIRPFQPIALWLFDSALGSISYPAMTALGGVEISRLLLTVREAIKLDLEAESRGS
jgi:hypothetical protein